MPALIGTVLATLARRKGVGVVVTQTIMRDSLVLRDPQRMTDRG